MKQKYYIILTNCDCCSDIIARPIIGVRNWFFGPRCPGCNKILGCMQWQLANENKYYATSQLDALQQYKKGKVKVMMLRGKDGKFISKQCPECDGKLQPEIDKYFKTVSWYCDGLIDPENTDLELQLCMYLIF